MKQVEKYYDQSSKYYLLFYTDRESLGFHYGYWDKNTKSRKEALLNQNREIAKPLQIQPGDLVLDAGCGVGGTSLWLAERTKANFEGINISEVQIRQARQFAKKRNLTDRVSFHQMDFNQTTFADKSFDKIFAIESFCHSYFNLLNIFREMYRILKQGGKLVMSDGILLRQPRNKQEQKWLNNFCKGWHVDTLYTVKEVINDFEEAGFKNINFIDRTTLARKGSNQIYKIRLYAYPVVKLLQLLRLTSHLVADNIYASISQKRMFDAGMMGHGTFFAEK